MWNLGKVKFKYIHMHVFIYRYREYQSRVGYYEI